MKESQEKNKNSASLTDKELEELRYDVSHYLLSKMSKGAQFQYALDRMLQLMSLYSEQDLREIINPKKKRDKGKPAGF